jgi:hypothetical protein
MRNLKEYPISVDEVIQSVQRAQADYNSLELIGGVDGVCLNLLEEFLEEQKERLQLFLYQQHNKEFGEDDNE